jgi:hypothetical protein
MRCIFHRLTAHAATIVTVCAVGAAVPHATRGGDAAGVSREELVRKWDLNSDGSIDEGEAEVARSRMRRDRAELQMKSGVDPLTGKPRILAVDEADPAAAPPPEQPEPERPRAKRAAGEAGLPGARVPDAKPPIPATRQPAAATDGRVGGPARADSGGRRPRPDLNAGRLPPGPTPQGLPGRRPAPASGGLLPNVRRPPAAPVSPPSPSRRTVDDFDVY